MRNRAVGITAGAVLLVGVVAGSCTHGPASPPPPFHAPGLNVVTEHFAGTILSGPRPVAVDGAFQLVTVRVTALEQPPGEILSSVSEGVQLIALRASRRTFVATPHLDPESRFGFGASALQAYEDALSAGRFGRYKDVASLAGAITPGVTVRFSVEAAEPIEASGPGAALREGYTVHVECKDADTLTVAVVVKRRAPSLASRSDPEATEEQSFQKEALILGDMPDQGRRAAVFLTPAPSARWNGVAFVVEAHRQPESGPEAELYADAVSRCKADLAQSAKATVPGGAGLAEALAGLGTAETTRRSLAFLGRDTGAAVTEDVALAATDEVVAQVAQRALEAAQGLPSPPDRKSLGWVLEDTALRLLCEKLKTDEPLPALEAMLARHTGQVGRRPVFLEDVLGRCASLEELAAALIQENLIFLLDTSPAVRVRAYDWLVEKAQAPEGYDPLAEKSSRRAAVNRWLSERPVDR